MEMRNTIKKKKGQYMSVRNCIQEMEKNNKNKNKENKENNKSLH